MQAVGHAAGNVDGGDSGAVEVVGVEDDECGAVRGVVVDESEEAATVFVLGAR